MREIQNIRQAIEWMAQARGDTVFLIAPETKRELTFTGLKRQSMAIAARLRETGLRRGDKVAFLLDNGLFTVQLFFGTMYAGLGGVPIKGIPR